MIVSQNIVSCYQYLTIEDGLFANAERHFAKAEYWLSVGKPHYANGSILKAHKKIDKANKYIAFLHVRLPIDFSEIINKMANDVARDIIYGTARLS